MQKHVPTTPLIKYIFEISSLHINRTIVRSMVNKKKLEITKPDIFKFCFLKNPQNSKFVHENMQI